MKQHRIILKRFGEYSVKLAEQLREGQVLSTEERISLENHLIIVHLALSTSKLRGGEKPQWWGK
jgi:hypothetical protein